MKNGFKIEWGLSLLNKYGTLIIEDQMQARGLTKTQCLFLIHLGNHPKVHQDHLAKIFKTNRSTVTRAINHLVDLGYVKRLTDKSNKKANLLLLTDEGHEVLMATYQAIGLWTEIITQDMSQEEISICEKMVGKMASNACKYLGDQKVANLIIKD